MPIVRIGNISLLKGDPISTKFKGFIEGYLIEARSIGGLSGSPVFVNIAPFRTVKGSVRPESGPQLYLLGLMHGHFDIADLNSDTVIDVPSAAVNGIHTGIGVVVPVQKIIDTIEHPDLVAMRRDDAMRQNKLAGASTASRRRRSDLGG